MRSGVVLLAFVAVVTGCASGAAAHPTANAHTTAAAAPLSAQIVLPSRTMTAGSQMSGRVVVDNNTGHAIHARACDGLFAVTLASRTYHPQAMAPAVSCGRTRTIPVGKSSYPVTVLASYLACSADGARAGLKACLPGNKRPPLPPGTYHTTLYQASQVVPAPPTITVRVTPSG
jgi:hypothetical protein